MFDATEWLVSTAPVTIRRRVLWGECDPAAVVYTPRFADYFASARDWFLRIGLDVFDRPHPAKAGLSFPMRALAFDFKSFLAADDIFDMQVTVTAISTRTFTILVSASHNDGRPSFTAIGTQVCVDQVTRSAVPLPERVVSSLSAYRRQIDELSLGS